MFTNSSLLDSVTALLPERITQRYTPKAVLVTNNHNTVIRLVSKKTDALFVLKILEKPYYHKKLFQAICRLKDKNLLLPSESFSDDSFFYFLYPCLQTLTEQLSKQGLSALSIEQLAKDLQVALHALHDEKILHLDVAPDNIYYDGKRFLLGDFSSARFAHEAPFFSTRPCTKTTAFFDPPSSKISAQNDWYSLSLLLYVLLNKGSLPTETLRPSAFLESLPSALRSTALQDYRISSPMLPDAMLQACTPELPLKNRLAPFAAPCSCDKETNKKKKLPLYGLLILCILFFLFSLFRYTAQLKSTPPSASKAGSPSAFTAPACTPAEPSASPIIPSASPSCEIVDISESGCATASFLDEIASPAAVEILFANTCQFVSGEPFLSLSNLKELYLNCNPLSSTDEFAQLPHLEVLVLSDCGLVDVSALSQIDTLTVLDLSHNDKLANVRSLANLEHLTYLVLTNTNVTQKDIQYLQETLLSCTILY